MEPISFSENSCIVLKCYARGCSETDEADKGKEKAEDNAENEEFVPPPKKEFDKKIPKANVGLMFWRKRKVLEKKAQIEKEREEFEQKERERIEKER